LATASQIRLGFKGGDILGEAYIYVPYTPLFVTPTISVSELKEKRFQPPISIRGYGDIVSDIGLRFEILDL